MEKYNNEISAGCGFDDYGNELQNNTPVQTLPAEMFHHNEIHQYIDSAPYTALNCVFYQANNQQHHNDMLNYSQPVSQHNRQQLAGAGAVYGQDLQQRQHQTTFLGINQSVARQEDEHHQKPQLTAHYGPAQIDETSVQATEQQYRLITSNNTQQLLRPNNTMATPPQLTTTTRLGQLKQHHHGLEYQQQQQQQQSQQSQCYAPNQAGYGLHKSAFNGFPITENFPVQQVAPECYANAADPYRGHIDVSLNENLAAVAEGEGLISDSTTAANAQYEQHQQQVLFGHEQIHSFTANNSNECINYSILPPPPPPSLNDDGDLNGGGQAAQNYYSPCEFINGEHVNQALNPSVLGIGHQNAQSSHASLDINLNSEPIVKLGKGAGADPSESGDQMHQTRQYSNFQYPKAEPFDEPTSHNQPPIVRDDQMMNQRSGFGPERSSGRLSGLSQQDYIDMRSSGNLSQEWLDMICRQMIEHMDSFGICVIDNFLGSIKGELILGEVKQLFSHRSYSTGRLVSDKLDSSSSGINASNDPAKTIRNDRVIWVDGCEEGCEEINNLIQTLCSVITNSSRLSLYSNNGLDKVVISKRTKAHVACYPGNGTRYIKHVDNPNGDGRVITAIYYLNKSWSTKKDGGLLRMFPAGVETVANIEPLFDRVLFFWSDRRNPHEVLPAYRDRYAITVWYIGDNRSQET